IGLSHQPVQLQNFSLAALVVILHAHEEHDSQRIFILDDSAHVTRLDAARAENVRRNAMVAVDGDRIPMQYALVHERVVVSALGLQGLADKLQRKTVRDHAQEPDDVRPAAAYVGLFEAMLHPPRAAERDAPHEAEERRGGMAELEVAPALAAVLQMKHR